MIHLLNLHYFVDIDDLKSSSSVFLDEFGR